MVKSDYREGLYYREGFPVSTSGIEDRIQALLRENHGVGIIGGWVEPGFPLYLVSSLTVQMLGYENGDEFEQATGNLMENLACGDYTEAEFAALSGEYEMYLCSKTGQLRARMVKHNFTSDDGREMWLASVCDMDTLYQTEQLVNRMNSEKEAFMLAQRAKLEKTNRELAETNRELERQKLELEKTLAEEHLQREVIAAIGSTYWLIFCLDLVEDSFIEVTSDYEAQHGVGSSGITSKRFPTACRQTIAPEYQETMLAFLDTSTLAERLSDRDEVWHEYQTLTGSWHIARFIAQKRDDDGRVVKALYTIQVINERKQLEREYEDRLAKAAEEAQLANVSKTDFLRRMSHDIRTPINGIRGMIEIANKFPDDMDKQREYRDKVWEASGYLLSLVNSVLDMNKLESGSTIIEKKPFDVIELLRESNSLAGIEAEKRGLDYIVQYSEIDVTHRHLLGSPAHLTQILMNLSHNAVRYNKPGGSVTVWCKELGYSDDVAVLKFACIDTGIGMSEEFQSHLFEPFTQEQRDDARTNYEGSGLGLSIVKRLVEQMGGTIDFTSTEGEGSAFYVTMPFSIDVDFEPELPSAVIDSIDLAPIRVLLVEDNDLNLEIAQFFLEEHGAHVVCARDGKQAVDAFAASGVGEFDLVLMDIMMPVMNGYEATQAIRAMDRPDATTVPIFALTANAFTDDVRHSLDAGMNEHLSKPLSTDKLLLTIYRYVDK